MVALATVLAAEFVNGWTDAPNVIATVVSTGVAVARGAIVMAVVFNVLGAMGGTAVAATVGKGIVAPSAMTLPAITATMLSIIAWGRLRLGSASPSASRTRCLRASPARDSLGAAGRPCNGPAGRRSASGSSARLGLASAAPCVIGKLDHRPVCRHAPNPGKASFDRLQLLSAAFMAFNHGLNDGQKFMGVFALTMLAGGATDVFEIPFWVILVCALTMGIGTSFRRLAHHRDGRHEDGAYHVLAGLCGADIGRLHDLRRVALRHPA